ncbi:MAG: hypothetical protein L6Q97_18390 [Thermoanaerobaculia bacterium]|nr:hypothetical protein [Thermoanaerobaculia bacterium]
MQESLLVQTLAALKRQERQEMHTFLHCPLYNGGKHARQILALFTLLAGYIEQKNGAIPEKEAVYEALFPGKTYRQGYFENLMSELMALLRQFLTQREIELRWGPAFESVAMARFYRERGLQERAKQTIHRAKTELANPSVDLDERRLLAFWREQEISLQECLNNQRRGDLNVPGTLHALTVFYGHKLLELATVLYQQQRVVPELQSDWEPFIDQFREILRVHAHFDDPAIFMLDEALKFLKTRPENPKMALEQFLLLFRKYEAALSPTLQKILAAYTRNFCVQYGNLLDGAFRLTLYKEHLEKGWLYEQGKLQPTTFINLVNISLSLGDDEWLWVFLQAHKAKIEGEQANYLELYGLARYYFQKQQWDKVEESILETRKLPKLSDAGLEKLMRILEIKTGYELAPEADRLENSLNNFTMFLQRNKRILIEKHRIMDKNFITIVRRMIRFHGQTDFKKREVENLQKTVSQVADLSYPLAERGWLHEKLIALQSITPGKR